MDAEEFRRRGKEMVDYVADYLENIRDRDVYPKVSPGYLHKLIPDEAPKTPESFDEIMKDVERVIMPGVTHWHHPHFHAYFPTANSYPAILGDILSGAIACIGFTWSSSPACTELEVVMMDWLGKMLDLPELFLSGGKGGGVIQGTASEATYVALLSARAKTLNEEKEKDPEIEDSSVLIPKLVSYCSDQAHSSVERAGLMGSVQMKKVRSDEKQSMRGEELRKNITEDIARGKIPFLVVATLGTTNSCAFDNIAELGQVCEEFNIWLHVDAAYAGSAFICPEFRHHINGIEKAMSFNFNPHKWLLVNFDCSAMWLREKNYLVDAFNVDPLYLKHEQQGKVPDYRHWQIPLGRRFRSLKMWFVMRTFGVEKMQEHIRRQVNQAHEFKVTVLGDDRFEIFGEVNMGLVCFRAKGSNALNERLNKDINSDGRIHMTPSKVNDTFFLRFAVCATRTQSEDIAFAWDVICEIYDKIVRETTLSNGEVKS